jgi:hypothetical protein
MLKGIGLEQHEIGLKYLFEVEMTQPQRGILTELLHTLREMFNGGLAIKPGGIKEGMP